MTEITHFAILFRTRDLIFKILICLVMHTELCNLQKLILTNFLEKNVGVTNV